MSTNANKKAPQQPYNHVKVPENANTSTSVVPPRYQPPPHPQQANPGGILKNPHQQAKDANKVHLTQQQPQQAQYPMPMKQQSEPNLKYYPVQSPPLNGVPNANKAPYQYPIGIPQQQGRLISQQHQQTLQQLGRHIEEVQIHEPPVPVGVPHHSGKPQQVWDHQEFIRQSTDMLKFVRKPDMSTDPRMIHQESAARALNMQGLVGELRNLKEANQRLADDNQELRDLCCFLDDDRQKGRKLAREWQRFGRYTASVMRQEVSAYQNKLRELDNKQQELIKDNLELKELCLYLDEERGGGNSTVNSSSVCPGCGSTMGNGGNLRDDGDGSSSSTNADEPAVPQQFVNGNTGSGNAEGAPRRTASRERLLHENLARQRSSFNDQIMQYVRSLESRVKQLEDDKRTLTHKLTQIATATGEPNLAVTDLCTLGGTAASAGMLSGRPEAVVRALQVLEVREQLEREGRIPVDRMIGPSVGDIQASALQQQQQVGMVNGGPTNGVAGAGGDMDDGEKALVREMCNVVWRKLEENPQARR